MATQQKRNGGPGEMHMNDKDTQSAIEAIDDVQNEIDKLNDQASAEILLVEQKYNKLRQPHYQVRSKHILQIPKFWLNTFLNHPQLCMLITPEDEQVLQHMTLVDVEEFDDIKSGFKINFHFSDNKFFKNKILTREFHILQDGRYPPENKATTIEWYPGKELPSANSAKNQKAGQKRSAPTDISFFQWFNNVHDPAHDDYGEMIKDEVWPNPLQFFLAGAGDEDEEEDGEGLEGEGLEDEDEVSEGEDGDE